MMSTTLAENLPTMSFVTEDLLSSFKPTASLPSQVISFGSSMSSDLTRTTPIFPPQTIRMTTKKSQNHPVNQGILLAAPLTPGSPFEIRETDKNLTFPVYKGRFYGDKQFARSTYMYVIPIVLFLCMLSTITFALILSRRLRQGSSMSRASCVILLSIATADILTMVFAIAEVSYMYSMATRHNMILPFDSCKTMLILERLSAIPHAASTWFTVILAVQRYMCVSFPFIAGKHINSKLSMICVLIVSFITVGFHFCRFLDIRFAAVLVEHPSKPGGVMETCIKVYSSLIHDAILYESAFAWTRIFLAQLLPCTLIVVFVLMMLNTLGKMKQATKHMQITGTKQQSQRRRLCQFTIVISSIVFCIEFSNAIFLSLNAWEVSTGFVLVTYETLKTGSLGFDLLLYLSYFVIFFLYCCMSGKFRSTLIRLCPNKCRSKKIKQREKITLDSTQIDTRKTPFTGRIVE